MRALVLIWLFGSGVLIALAYVIPLTKNTKWPALVIVVRAMAIAHLVAPTIFGCSVTGMVLPASCVIYYAAYLRIRPPHELDKIVAANMQVAAICLMVIFFATFIVLTIRYLHSKYE
jgi:hypothetical protein